MKFSFSAGLGLGLGDGPDAGLGDGDGDDFKVNPSILLYIKLLNTKDINITYNKNNIDIVLRDKFIL